MSEPSPITQHLRNLRAGDAGAFDRLVGLLYADLRNMARAQLAPHGPQTLNPTALVHEAYLRLAGREDLNYADRDHFLAVCSVVMRNIAIDFARRRKASKRGGDRERVTLDENVFLIDAQAEDLIAIDQR